MFPICRFGYTTQKGTSLNVLCDEQDERVGLSTMQEAIPILKAITPSSYYSTTEVGQIF